ncbi:39S ribosomal protein L23, mitochondrial [Turdus rufiventris]|nr:39S ribosomal protein L23, mitochondrial [Turdus rufiventris]
MLAVRPGVPQPEDTVQFRVSMEMTKLDIKNYLEKIYNVPVATVRTRIQYGANNKRNHRNQRVKKPDYKVAYVQLGQGQTFQFPNLFPEKEQDAETRSFDDFRDKYLEKEKEKQEGNSLFFTVVNMERAYPVLPCVFLTDWSALSKQSGARKKKKHLRRKRELTFVPLWSSNIVNEPHKYG